MPEELADPVRRREPDHQHAVGDLDATEAAPEDRARDEEQRRSPDGPNPIAIPPRTQPDRPRHEDR